jgi:beta-phosphoglucomutase
MGIGAEERRMGISAVIFDLDGVIVSTDEFHYRAWQRLADEERIPFGRGDNEALRGVSRAECLEIMLSKSSRSYSEAEKAAMMGRKNDYYRRSLEGLGPKDILPGIPGMLSELKQRGIAVAIGSSSKNTPLILEKIGYAGAFDAVADGNDITKSKPDPEVFLIAARRLGKDPAECLVVEDAEAGLAAALEAGMRAFGVGGAARSPLAHSAATSLERVSIDELLGA